MKRLYACSIMLVGAWSANNLSASILYENALPNILLNQNAGALRSNVSFTESNPFTNFDGTSVNFSQARLGTDSVIVNSITNWSVASVLGDALGLEFTSVSLYFRPEGGTWQVAKDAQGNAETADPNTFFDSTDPNLVLSNNPDVTFEQVPYTRSVSDYQSLNPGTPDLYYPVWQNTFSGLNLVLKTGVNYEFAVWGTNPNADSTTLYGYWFNHYSNPFLSGAREDDKSGTYLRCDFTNLSAPCFVEDPKMTQTWDKGASFNIEIDGQAVNTTPEPSTMLLGAAGIVGFALLQRRRARTLKT